MFPAIREHDVRFHQLDARTGNRIRIKRVDEKTGTEVGYGDIVRGYETSPGRHVEVTDEEIEALKPRTTKTIDIEDFVDLAEIDPIYYKRTYYLAPDDQEGAQKAYALLRDAMIDQGKVGIGRVVMREKQYLAAIRPVGRVLAMSTMLFADEVVDPAKMREIPAVRSRPSPREAAMAGRLIASLASKWNPRKYKDTYERELRHLIEQKRRGKQITVAEQPAEPENVVDLMAALEASLQKGGRGGRSRRAPRPAAKKAATTGATRARKSTGASRKKTGTARGTAKKARSGKRRSAA
ncbi:MAG TPA: Ku protein [Acidimicrobiia bacterium]|nr:Ku protein [Acidimicrobiia bacterium]